MLSSGTPGSASAEAFVRAAKREGIRRVVYLGGPGDDPASKHLCSRHRTARILEAEGPPLTYFGAGMVVEARGESYRTCATSCSDWGR